jgi:WNK lysine deficient protein kinase
MNDFETNLIYAPEYADDTSIEKFVNDTATATNRERKSVEWAAKLRAQDIMTVGDLRGLHDEDWSGIGLTVFALRALKNMLRHSKKLQQQQQSE